MGEADGARCARIAQERWPDHSLVATQTHNWLVPLTWFDAEIADIFGLDFLAGSALRERGWAVLENEWVEILALRFEQLGAVLPRLGDFVGTPDLTLRIKNVTSKKPVATDCLPAFEDALATPAGRACVALLRASRYAKACGYGESQR